MTGSTSRQCDYYFCTGRWTRVTLFVPRSIVPLVKKTTNTSKERKDKKLKGLVLILFESPCKLKPTPSVRHTPLSIIQLGGTQRSNLKPHRSMPFVPYYLERAFRGIEYAENHYFFSGNYPSTKIKHERCDDGVKSCH